MKRFAKLLCRMSWHQWNYEKHFTLGQEGEPFQQFFWFRRCERCEIEERFSGVWIHHEQGNGLKEEKANG